MDQSTTRILSQWADTKKDFSREDMRQITQTLKQEAQASSSNYGRRSTGRLPLPTTR